MSDMLLYGTRRWNAIPGVIGFENQYDEAVEVVCSYIADAIQMNRSAMKSNPEAYFSVAPFSLLGDLNGAVDLIRRTPEKYHRTTLNRIVQQLPRQWASIEGITLWFEMIWNETLDEQLSRVWRSPEYFPRSAAFDQELGNRAMAYSLPATTWSGPLKAEIIRKALNQLVLDHEQSKSQLDFGLHLLNEHSFSRELVMNKKKLKALKRDFRLKDFTLEWHEIYSAHSDLLNRRISHVISYSDLMGWGLRHPQLSANRG